MFYYNDNMKLTVSVKPTNELNINKYIFLLLYPKKDCEEMAIALTLSYLTWLESTFRIDAFDYVKFRHYLKTCLLLRISILTVEKSEKGIIKFNCYSQGSTDI